MDAFDLTFLSREDVKTYFRINKVPENLQVILKVLSFYTLALFETNSHERVIFYRLNGEKIGERIDDTCIRLFKKFILMNSKEDFKEDSKEDIKEDSKEDSKEGSKEDFKEDSKEGSEEDSKEGSEDKDEFFTLLREITWHGKTYEKIKNKPVIKYKLIKRKCRGEAWLSDSDSKFETTAWNFNMDITIPVKIVKRIGEIEDNHCPRNYGSYINKDNRTVLKETIKDRYVMFDFDRFEVQFSTTK